MTDFPKYRLYGAYHWDSFEQGGAYRDHVLKVIEWIKEKKVLDIGCGDGLITSRIGAKGIDTDEEGIRLAQSHGVPSEVMSAYDVSGKYDAVYLGDTLEHLEYPDKAIEAIKKITDIVYIVVPTEPDIDDLSEWNKNSLRVFMQNLGWQEEYSDVANFRIYGKYTKQVKRKRVAKVLSPKPKKIKRKSAGRGKKR